MIPRFMLLALLVFVLLIGAAIVPLNLTQPRPDFIAQKATGTRAVYEATHVLPYSYGQASQPEQTATAVIAQATLTDLAIYPPTRTQVALNRTQLAVQAIQTRQFIQRAGRAAAPYRTEVAQALPTITGTPPTPNPAIPTLTAVHQQRNRPPTTPTATPTGTLTPSPTFDPSRCVRYPDENTLPMPHIAADLSYYESSASVSETHLGYVERSAQSMCGPPVLFHHQTDVGIFADERLAPVQALEKTIVALRAEYTLGRLPLHTRLRLGVCYDDTGCRVLDAGLADALRLYADGWRGEKLLVALGGWLPLN